MTAGTDSKAALGSGDEFPAPGWPVKIPHVSCASPPRSRPPSTQPSRTCRIPNSPTANIRGLSSELLSMAVDRTKAQPRALVQVSGSTEGPKAPMKRPAGAGVEHQPSRGEIDRRIPGPYIAEIDHAGQRAVGAPEECCPDAGPREASSPGPSRLQRHRPAPTLLAARCLGVAFRGPRAFPRTAASRSRSGTPRKGFNGTPASGGHMQGR